MNQELQEFAQQLALWTELIIENGRTPFRRVDLFPSIHTDQGVLCPPLIFWINRQSMMAGGLLMIPERDLDRELQRGRSCCNALGLKHFVTWESDRVRIWQIETDGIGEHFCFELGRPDNPDSFRYLLGDILEKLKLLAVIGLVPNPELSTHYLHNLFQTTLDLARPALTNAYRSLRAETSSEQGEDADKLAEEANRLLLLQLLALAWANQLPEAILPEKIERAIQISLPALPEPLRTHLSAEVTATPPELPHDAAVCFHHLLLRLRQLQWRATEERALVSIVLLITGWGTAEETSAEVQFNPQSLPLAPQVKLVLSDSPSFLAASSLLDFLLNQPQRALQCGSLFQFDYMGHTGLTASGTINSERQLTREERQQYSTLLRTSWPNRRFRIGSDKPLWYWELIHLLGLSRSQKQLRMVLPAAIIETQPDEPFWSLCQDNYTFQRVSSLEGALIELELTPGHDSADFIEVHIDGETRTCSAQTERVKLRNLLLLTLKLPATIYPLLEDKLTWLDDQEISAEEQHGLELFLHSQFARRIGGIINLDLLELKHTEQSQQLHAVPLPNRFLLKELTLAAKQLSQPTPAPDQLLADLLDAPAVATIAVPDQKSTTRSHAGSSADKSLREELLGQMYKIGVPNFPEQYLYFLDQPDTSIYQFTPPLQVRSELLGEFVLEDAEGKRLQIYGQELANALLLCAALGRTEVELPSDRQQLALLQKQYGKDLKKLHKQLSGLCHSRLQDPKAANKLSKKIWKQLGLPKPGLIYQLR